MRMPEQRSRLGRRIICRRLRPRWRARALADGQQAPDDNRIRQRHPAGPRSSDDLGPPPRGAASMPWPWHPARPGPRIIALDISRRGAIGRWAARFGLAANLSFLCPIAQLRTAVSRPPSARAATGVGEPGTAADHFVPNPVVGESSWAGASTAAATCCWNAFAAKHSSRLRATGEVHGQPVHPGAGKGQSYRRRRNPDYRARRLKYAEFADHRCERAPHDPGFVMTSPDLPGGRREEPAPGSGRGIPDAGPDFLTGAGRAPGAARG